MAIKPTPNNNMFKSLVFDGVDSRDYGIYITGDAVFNSPERDVEMIEIPGRNGAYALDKGRFSNIKVSYPAGIAGDTEADFREGISAFRNALASRKGYKRLEDDYNPDEYRMAVYKSGLEVTPKALKAGEFTITFDCKPQRFLKSGETAVTIGGDVTNTKTETGSIVSIEGTGVDKVTSLVAQITPKQAGSGDPSPSNVRPISGWTDAGINISPYEQTEKHTITGRNLYNAPNNRHDVMIPCHIPAGTVVTISATSAGVPGMKYYNASGAEIDYWTLSKYDSTLGRHYRTFTTKTSMGDTEYVMFYGASGTDYMIELGSTLHAYEPYGYHTPVPLGQTVYGGTVDVVTGVLTMTHGFYNYGSISTTSGSAVTGGWRCNFQCPSDDVNRGKLSVQTGGQPVLSMFNQKRMNEGGVSKGYSANEYTVIVPNATSKAEADAALKNLQIVYKLATPQTYQLTPQQVKLLTGQNHVWADTGDITITWGDDPNKLVNPTLYNANPLLSFTASGNGSGNIIINNNTISVTNKPIGDIVLANVVKLESGKYVNWQDTSRYLSGDAIRIESIPEVQTTVVMDSYSYANYTSYRSDDMDYLSTISTPRGMLITHSIPNPPQFVAGTTKSAIYTATVIEKVKEKTTGDIVDNTIDITVQITYDGLNRITVTSTVTVDLGTATTAVTLNTITVNSTKQSLIGTAYIDLDIGEAYAIDRGAVVSINDSVSLGASLPVLKPGVNIISKTGAVENLKVTPRWWEL